MKKIFSLFFMALLSTSVNAQISQYYVPYKPVIVPRRDTNTNQYNYNSTPQNNYNVPRENFQIVMGYYVDKYNKAHKHKLKINTVAGPRVFLRGIYDYNFQDWIDTNSEATETYKTIDGEMANYYEWRILVPELGATVYFNN